MADFDWARDTAAELLAEFGVASTLRKLPQTASADPNKPWRVTSGGTPTDVTVQACFLASAGESLRYDENGQTRRGSLLGIIAAPLSPPPELGDQLFSSPSTIWTIKAVRENAPDGEPIYWELVLDK